jgi:hypothetical protein
MNPLLSLPPACWSWEVPPLLTEDSYLRAARPVLGDTEALGGLPAAWRFTQFHQGRCSLCGRPSPLVVDHDHWSGLVRGLLCYGCNSLEGRNSTTNVIAFAGYRRRHPAIVLGYYEPYRVGRTCLAFIDARTRAARKWRLTLSRAEDPISVLLSATHNHAPRWVKLAPKIETLWQGVTAAHPFTASSYELVETLHDLLTIAADTATRVAPDGDPVSNASRQLVAELQRLLQDARTQGLTWCGART